MSTDPVAKIQASSISIIIEQAIEAENKERLILIDQSFEEETRHHVELPSRKRTTGNEYKMLDRATLSK